MEEGASGDLSHRLNRGFTVAIVYFCNLVCSSYAVLKTGFVQVRETVTVDGMGMGPVEIDPEPAVPIMP